MLFLMCSTYWSVNILCLCVCLRLCVCGNFLFKPFRPMQTTDHRFRSNFYQWSVCSALLFLSRSRSNMKKTFECNNSMVITIPIRNLRDGGGHLVQENFTCVFKDFYKVFVHRGKPKHVGVSLIWASETLSRAVLLVDTKLKSFLLIYFWGFFNRQFRLSSVCLFVLWVRWERFKWPQFFPALW